MKNTYKPPILCGVFRVLGYLTLLAGIAAVTLAIIALVKNAAEDTPIEKALRIAPGLMLCFTSLVYFGIAQLINFVGLTARNTGQMVDQLDQVVAQLGRRASAVGMAESRFYYSSGKKEEGPFSVEEMRELMEAGLITDITPIFKDGDPTWRTSEDFAELG